jgi:hypothetical protein
MRHLDEAQALHSDACPCRVAIEAHEALIDAESRYARLEAVRQARIAITSGLRLAERDRRAAGRALAPAILAAGGDPTEEARRARCEELAADAAAREALEARHGKVWDTSEMQEAFSVSGFAAPFVVVVRKSDGKKGSLEFQARPRFYFNFAADGRE